MIASKALITPHIPHGWIVRPGCIYIYYANPRKEWGGKARIRLTEMSPYDMNLLKNVAHK